MDLSASTFNVYNFFNISAKTTRLRDLSAETIWCGKSVWSCLHRVRKILELGRSYKADHPSATYFLYSVYMQKIVLGLRTRIFPAKRSS